MGASPGRAVAVLDERGTAGAPVLHQRGTNQRFGGKESRGATKPVASATDDGRTLDVRPEQPRWAPPLKDRTYIDNAIKSVSLSFAGYVLHWTGATGAEHTTTIPESWIVRTRDRRTYLDLAEVYATRQQALESLTPRILRSSAEFNVFVGFWKNQNFPFIVPTVFSDVSTPRIMAAIDAKDEQMRRAALRTAEDLRGVAIGLGVGKALGTAYRSAVRAFSGGRTSTPTSSRTTPNEPTETFTSPPRSGGGSSSTYSPPAQGESGTAPPISGSTARTAVPRSTPSQRITSVMNRSTPPPQPGPLPVVRESKGATVRTGPYQSASASTSRSVITAVRADVAESQAYMEALFRRGEIGLQRPEGANVPGVDFITARIDALTGEYQIVITDVKMSTIGKFPTPATQIPATWMTEVQNAVGLDRLDLGDPVLEAQIRQAFTKGNVVLRQVNVNYSPAPSGQGTMTGW